MKSPGRRGRAGAGERKTGWICGRHVVEESLASRECRVLEVWLSKEDQRRLSQVARVAERAGARVRWVARGDLDRVAGGAAHQGLSARVERRPGKGLDGFLAGLTEREKAESVLVALDRIQDPRNLGAIVRSAACLGARAVVVPDRHSAPMSQTVLQSSAGAAGKIPTFRVGNLAATLLRLKDAGYWVYGADPSGRPAWGLRLNTPLVLVVGSEGKGMRSLVRSYCDELVAIPQSEAGVASLNASCAASVLLYEVMRQAGSGAR
ncbi:MAG: 23S rRNA (guanosine(2251)-2'-O)-methyltransferase RlmB [Elusimicrobiota bacterium]